VDGSMIVIAQSVIPAPMYVVHSIQETIGHQISLTGLTGSVI